MNLHCPQRVSFVRRFHCGCEYYYGYYTVVLQTTTQPFANFSYSLLKTLTMTVGEFDETDNIFYSVPNIVTYDVVTYVLWIIFLAVMPILLQNMLVSCCFLSFVYFFFFLASQVVGRILL